MDLLDIRKLMREKPIYDIPMRVTFYARVSSEKDAQLNSLGNQVSYYSDMIKECSNWTYVPGYIDEGVSGMTTGKRENFHRMINDAKDGKFDLIITKEISRFARNTFDSIGFTRELLAHRVGVFFQNDNINTLDEDSELRLTIMSAIAQDELRKLSSRVKFGHQQSIKKGVVLGADRIYGYHKKDGKLQINESQAVMIRTIFSLYASGEYSMNQIEQVLYDKGYRSFSGGRISHPVLAKIIRNPKYKGYYCGNKVRIIDMFTKEQKFLDEDEWIMYKDKTGETVPEIVDEALWAQANEVLESRSIDVKNRQNKFSHGNLLTGKLTCTHCNAPYYRKDSVDKKGNRNSRWACSHRLSKGAKSCPSFYVLESELRPVLFEVFSEAASNMDGLLDRYANMYREMSRSNDTEKEIESLNKEIAHLELRKQKLLGYNVDGKISDSDFLDMNAKLTDSITEAEDRLDSLKGRVMSDASIEEKIRSIRSAFSGAKKAITGGSITKSFVDRYIDQIYVTPTEGALKLEIKLATEESVERTLNVVRMGNTFKDMYPVRTMTLHRHGPFGHKVNVKYRYTISI